MIKMVKTIISVLLNNLVITFGVPSIPYVSEEGRENQVTDDIKKENISAENVQYLFEISIKNS